MSIGGVGGNRTNRLKAHKIKIWILTAKYLILVEHLDPLPTIGESRNLQGENPFCPLSRKQDGMHPQAARTITLMKDNMEYR